MTPFIVGITGGIATGKTNVTNALEKAGVKVIDADEISRSLTKDNGKALRKIRRAFGKQVFTRKGLFTLSLNRRALGDMVFRDPEKKQQLEGILHPMIFAEIDRQIAKSKGIVFLSAPLLYECNLEKECHQVWCTFVPEDEQIRRLMGRDNMSRENALLRLKGQMPADEKARRADFVINTSGSPEQSASIALAAYKDLQQKLM